MVWFKRRRRVLNLALQGGGAHGAFTWGVLDRLLDEDDLDIGWISATSAGAVNAVALAGGMASGGREGARRALAGIWQALVEAGVPDFIRLNPFLYGLSRSTPMSQMASLWSPYEFNPLGFDPLRRLLEDHIDFEKLKASAPVELLIAATQVSTGQVRLFRRHEMTVEAVLASACLPTLHHAVVIEGEAYWDGGFSANPDLVTLALESPFADTLIVKLSPLTSDGVPTSVGEIAAHANRLTFNAPLLRDVKTITTARTALSRRWGRNANPLTALALARFHLIDAGRHTAGLRPETKVKPDAGLFTYLHGAGRTEAHKWLSRHKSDIGRRETVDLEARFLNPQIQPEPAAPPAAAPATPGMADDLAALAPLATDNPQRRSGSAD